MNISLLGGAFNPPHVGHMMIARQVLDFTDTDEVWFVPNFGQLPPKPDMASVEDRLAMVGLLQTDDIKVSTLEIDNKLNGNTINLLPFLPSEHTYKFVIGSDQLPVFHLWGQWEELLKKIPFLVFPRYGYPSEPLYKNMTMIQHESLIVTDLSSTKIRMRVKMGLSVSEFVDPRVGEYIKSKGLYK